MRSCNSRQCVHAHAWPDDLRALVGPPSQHHLAQRSCTQPPARPPARTTEVGGSQHTGTSNAAACGQASVLHKCPTCSHSLTHRPVAPLLAQRCCAAHNSFVSLIEPLDGTRYAPSLRSVASPRRPCSPSSVPPPRPRPRPASPSRRLGLPPARHQLVAAQVPPALERQQQQPGQHARGGAACVQRVWEARRHGYAKLGFARVLVRPAMSSNG